MKLSPLNIQRLIFIFLILIIIVFTKSYLRNKDRYQTTLFGTIEKFKEIKTNTYLIKFKGTSDFNVLSTIKTELKLNKGDSIYKPMFSDTFFIFKKNKSGEFEKHETKIY